MVKGYNYTILYYPGMANVVDDALSQNKTNTRINDMCLRMNLITPFFEMFKKAQNEAVKEEK